MADKFTDILTYVLSVALAAGVITFAAYKVVVLNGMDDPPANLGLNFPAPKRKVIMEGPGVGDMLTTQSLRDAGSGDSTADGAGSGVPGDVVNYELLTVVDGVAFVAINGEAAKTLVPVTIGSRLPGGLLVSGIGRSGGRWWLTAGTLRLEQVLPPQ